jgi:hypothetical protein
MISRKVDGGKDVIRQHFFHISRKVDEAKGLIFLNDDFASSGFRDVDGGKNFCENSFSDGFDSSGFETSTVDALFRIRPEQQIKELAKQAAKYWSQSADQVI